MDIPKSVSHFRSETRMMHIQIFWSNYQAYDQIFMGIQIVKVPPKNAILLSGSPQSIRVVEVKLKEMLHCFKISMYEFCH